MDKEITCCVQFEDLREIAQPVRYRTELSQNQSFSACLCHTDRVGKEIIEDDTINEYRSEIGKIILRNSCLMPVSQDLRTVLTVLTVSTWIMGTMPFHCQAAIRMRTTHQLC